MTVTSRQVSQRQDSASRSPRYTRLEQAVMDALAHDLRRDIPDLAGQFADSRASQRRNSGFGLFTEMIVARDRPAPASGPTGDLGTVHAMVGALPDPIAFRVRVRNGVLLGLLGDSYGQDTRAIDFATVAFDQVFTVDADGRSVAFEPADLMPRSPLLDLQRHDDDRSARVAAPPLKNVGPLQKRQEIERPATPPAQARAQTRATPPATRPQDVFLDQIFGARRSGPAPDAPPETDLTDGEKTALRAGLWFALFCASAVLVLVFEAPIAVVFILAVMAGRFLQTERGLKMIRRAIEDWKRSKGLSS